MIKNNLIFCHQFQNAAAKIIFLAGPLTRPPFHFSCNSPICLAPQLLFSAFNELSLSFCHGILHQISTHTFDLSLHWLQLSSRYTVKPEPSCICQIVKRSQKMLLKANFVYQVADLLHTNSISSFVHSFIFSSVNGSCHSQIGIKNIYTMPRPKKGKC